MGASVKASVTVISTMTTEIANLATALEAGFEQHPAAKVIRSLPGLVPPRRNPLNVDQAATFAS
jgi:hypothetical protein